MRQGTIPHINEGRERDTTAITVNTNGSRDSHIKDETERSTGIFKELPIKENKQIGGD